MVQCEPSIPPKLELFPSEGFKEVKCFLIFKHLVLSRVFLESLNEMDLFFLYLEALNFHVRFHLVQLQPHLFCFGFLPHEGV